MVSVVSDIDLPKHVPESEITPAGTGTSLEKLFSLGGRTIVVTGAGRGLGITLATAVLEAGADAICLDVLDEPSSVEWAAIKTVEKQTRVLASYYKCDVTNEGEVKQILEKAVNGAKERGKPIRGMINSAGIQLMKDAIDYPMDGFRRVMEVNVTGSMIMSKHIAQTFITQGVSGSIVLIASMSGQIANRGLHCSGYNASKAAVQQLCRSLAAEWGQHGIRVNTLSPGYIRTAMTDQLLQEQPQLERQWMEGALLGRLGAPEDFKAPTVFLLGDGACWMTGADLRVDGGHCATA